MSISTKEQLWLATLLDAQAALNKAGIEGMLDSGTLLGAIRDQCFLPWDNDIDIAIIAEDLQERRLDELGSLLANMGFSIDRYRHAIYCQRNSVHIGFVLYKKRSPAEFCSHFETINMTGKVGFLLYFIRNCLKGSWVICYGPPKKAYLKKSLYSAVMFLSYPFSKKWLINKIEKILDCKRRVLVIPDHLLNGSSTIKFYTHEFCIPAKYKEYLIHRYGANWKTPVKNWNYIEDDQSLE